jgi:hypothetical protein
VFSKVCPVRLDSAPEIGRVLGFVDGDKERLSELSRKGGASLSEVTVSPYGDANILEVPFIIRVISAIRL